MHGREPPGQVAFARHRERRAPDAGDEREQGAEGGGGRPETDDRHGPRPSARRDRIGDGCARGGDPGCAQAPEHDDRDHRVEHDDDA